ncbi:MAG: transglycosylase SLT domain-containing protein [Burkholderiaceae bacterium]|nr:transglycosylase SLT domain-containing protein [Burkholderiaceae bacterium]
MKFFDAALLRLRLALLAGALVVLAGCASTGPATPVKPQTEAAVPVTVAPQRATGPMQPLAAAEASSRAVALLRPPADLWERIRRGYAMPNLDTELVRDREQWYAARPEYMQRMANRSSKYLFHIVEELERRNMPTELALLPFIESAFNPQAVSSAKAAGMWQFMPATGKDFELKQNAFRDDRRDVLESTRAALDYLQKLYGMFGDWQLALAAYNWGEGSVGRAIARNKAAGLPTGYTDLNMPNETRYYVPKLQAVKNIVTDPGRYNTTLPEIGNHPYFETVPITRDIDVALAARLAQVSVEDFKALNPSANKPVILAAGSTNILLPWDNATLFERNLAAYSESRLASWTAWVAPRTMKPADAAQSVGMSESEFRNVNNIPPRMLIKVGSTLLITRSDKVVADVAPTIADNGQIALAPDVTLKRSVVRTRKGDTLTTLARRYGVSTESIVGWNKLSASASLKTGQSIVLFLPKAASSGRSSASSSGKSTRKQAAPASNRNSKSKPKK